MLLIDIYVVAITTNPNYVATISNVWCRVKRHRWLRLLSNSFTFLAHSSVSKFRKSRRRYFLFHLLLFLVSKPKLTGNAFSGLIIPVECVSAALSDNVLLLVLAVVEVLNE